MRVVHPCLLLAICSSASACGGAPPTAHGDTAPDSRETAQGVAPPASGDAERADSGGDAELAAKLVDLEAMCKALDHDYVDGTLSDYFAGIEPTTTWGKTVRKKGNDAMQPGRVLEAALLELRPAPPPPSCEKLIGYLDDVE